MGLTKSNQTKPKWALLMVQFESATWVISSHCALSRVINSIKSYKLKRDGLQNMELPLESHFWKWRNPTCISSERKHNAFSGQCSKYVNLVGVSVAKELYFSLSYKFTIGMRYKCETPFQKFPHFWKWRNTTCIPSEKEECCSLEC